MKKILSLFCFIVLSSNAFAAFNTPAVVTFKLINKPEHINQIHWSYSIWSGHGGGVSWKDIIANPVFSANFPDSHVTTEGFTGYGKKISRLYGYENKDKIDEDVKNGDYIQPSKPLCNLDSIHDNATVYLSFENVYFGNNTPSNDYYLSCEIVNE